MPKIPSRPRIRDRRGDAAPEPPNPTDLEVIEGPNRLEIAELLNETTRIAQAEWGWRHRLARRKAIWVRLDELGVSQARMHRAYAVAGKPIITPPTISQALTRHKEDEARRQAKAAEAEARAQARKQAQEDA